jgi:hypothetical protein
VTVKLKPAKGSAAVPKVLGVLGPGGEDLLAQAKVKEKKTSATVTLSMPAPGGDLVVLVDGRDGTTGVLTWSFATKPPTGYPFSLPDEPTRSSD